MAELVGAIDQGTTSTRFMVFDAGGREVASSQLEHRQLLPRPGWVEHDPEELWQHTRTVVASALVGARLTAGDLAAIGITNQRETSVVWDRNTGRPYGNAIVWQDTRTDRIAAALERDGHGDVIRDAPACLPRRTSPPGSFGGCSRTFPRFTRRLRAATPSSAPSTAGFSGSSRQAPSTPAT